MWKGGKLRWVRKSDTDSLPGMQGKRTGEIMDIDGLREMLEKLNQAISEAKLMNEDRRNRLRLLVGIMEDVLFEERLSQEFFSAIRGGEAL